MNNQLFVLRCTLLLLLSVAEALSAAPVYQMEEEAPVYVNQIGEYLVDDTGAETPGQLLSETPAFQPLDTSDQALLLGRERRPVWIRFTADNPFDSERELILEMSFISMDYWDVFIPTNSGYQQIALGDKRPYNNRLIESGNYAVPITLPPRQQTTIYMRAQTDGIMFVPAEIFPSDQYRDHAVQRAGYYRLFAGVAMGLFLFSLMLGLHTREKIYYLYCVLVLARMLWMLNTEGSGFRYIQSYPVLIEMSSVGLISVYTAALVVFHSMFLHLEKFFPNIKRVLIGVVGFYLLAGVVLPLVNFSLATVSVQLALIITNLALIGTTVWCAWRRVPLSIAYLIAIAPPIVLNFYANLANLDVLPLRLWIVPALAFAFSLSLIILSFALAARIHLINQQKARAEAEALQAKVEAKTKSDFLAQISHEIRTPMNGVLGVSELLGKTGLNENQKRYNDIIHSSGSLLLQLINDVLDYSKIQAGKMTLEKIPFQPRQLFDEVRDVFQNDLEEKSLTFSVSIDDDVPPQLIGDPTRIRQILFNLVSNAYKFTKRGGIWVKMSRQGLSDQYTIAVKDTGAGIGADVVDNLFMPYYQSSAAISREHGGTGLGLSICKQLCELMGGEIGVRSKEGKGSTFWFCLPLAQPRVSRLTAAPVPVEPASDQNTQTPLHVLIVEDNAVNQVVAKGMLSSLGHSSVLAGNGQEALACLQRKDQQFDLVLMDCEMPKMDGLTATKKIRQLPDFESLPIVALTAHALSNQPIKCLEAGMDAYLAKPLTLNSLRNAIADVLKPETAI